VPQAAVNGDARVNGQPDRPAAPPRQRRLTKLDQEIIDYDKVHPGLSLDALRKKFGSRSKEQLAELLGRTP
jgi:hypothetical protein